MRLIYRALSLLGMARSIQRGGVAGLAKNRARAHAHKALARLLRRVMK